MSPLSKPHLNKFTTWMFDLDDTLVWNCVFYNRPILDFVEYLAVMWKFRVPSSGTIIRLQEDIDCGLAKQINPRTGKLYGFSSDRFPDAFALTYKALCEDGFGVYDETVADECRHIGMGAFNPDNFKKVGLVEHATELLDLLQTSGKRLVLVTKGEGWVQESKIAAFNLTRWFEPNDIHIVDNKDGATYLEILEELNDPACTPESTVVVGNSFSSDIKPALACGMHAVFIPCSTWKAESVHVEEMDEDTQRRFREVKTMSEVITMLDVK